LLRSARAWQVMALGALFAVSFDALALAGLFAMLTESSDRVSGAVMLATLFASGMIALGAANGIWVARLVRHSHATGKQATRVVAFAVGLAGLCISACALMTLAVPSFDRWFAENELILSAAVVTVVLAGYCGALFRQRSDATTSVRATLILGSTAASAPSTTPPSTP
jgi:nickel/cobalt transporter (NiCoT) family protein